MKLDNYIQKDFALNNIITMKSGGRTELFFEYNGEEERLFELYKYIKEKNLNYHFIGGGSNIIFVKDYQGILIRNIDNKLELLKDRENKNNIFINISAGYNWDNFVLYCLQNNYYGLENLSHIPGDISGAPIQNIGAYGVEVGDYIDSVRVFDFEDGEIRVLNNKECQFSYRDSIFKKKKSYFVLDVIFKLNRKWQPNIIYKDLKNRNNEKAFQNALELRDFIIEIRNKKIPLPTIIPNCGSFFKNIIINKKQLDIILQLCPEMIYFEYRDNSDEELYKLSTGYIIDKVLNMRGVRINNVGTNENNALQIV